MARQAQRRTAKRTGTGARRQNADNATAFRPERDPKPFAAVDRAGMTYEEAGHYLGCSDRMVRQLVADGKLRPFYIGRAARVSKMAADEFMANGGAPSAVNE